MAILVDFSGARITRLLDALAADSRLFDEIVIDNGPEMTSRAMSPTS